MNPICKQIGHNWNLRCVCSRCGQTQDLWHHWERISPCRLRCVDCGREKEFHDWRGCTCARCGAIRDEGHAFDIADCVLDSRVIVARCRYCGRELKRFDYLRQQAAVSARPSRRSGGMTQPERAAWAAWFLSHPLPPSG